jgi:hypothetical protein
MKFVTDKNETIQVWFNYNYPRPTCKWKCKCNTHCDDHVISETTTAIAKVNDAYTVEAKVVRHSTDQSNAVVARKKAFEKLLNTMNLSKASRTNAWTEYKKNMRF